MIGLLSTISLALIWLGYETDWMRVRLSIGIGTPIIEYEFKTWDELKPYNPNKQYPFWVRFPDYMSPLCGWDYVKNTMHIVPQYNIEITAFGVRNTITVKDGGSAKLLKDIAKSTLGSTRKQKLAYA